jgi:hypothetical protein
MIRINLGPHESLKPAESKADVSNANRYASLPLVLAAVGFLSCLANFWLAILFWSAGSFIGLVGFFTEYVGAKEHATPQILFAVGCVINVLLLSFSLYAALAFPG